MLLEDDGNEEDKGGDDGQPDTSNIADWTIDSKCIGENLQTDILPSDSRVGSLINQATSGNDKTHRKLKLSQTSKDIGDL